MSEPKKFNLLLLGDQAVGKTSLLDRYIESVFKEVAGTAGLDIRQKIIEINGEQIKLTLYDSAGHSKFRNVALKQVNNADGLLIVYDVTDLNSFDGAKKWLESCYSKLSNSRVYILLGNKIDLTDQISVQREEAEAIASQYGAIFYETSAKTGDNVDAAFSKAVNVLYNKKKTEVPTNSFPNEENPMPDRRARKKNNEESSCCCIQ